MIYTLYMYYMYYNQITYSVLNFTLARGLVNAIGKQGVSKLDFMKRLVFPVTYFFGFVESI